MEYHPRGGVPRGGGDPRTPMAWQHRDVNGVNGAVDPLEGRYEAYNGMQHHHNRATPRASASPPPRSVGGGGNTPRGPPTPGSAHSRKMARTPDHRRRGGGGAEPRGSSSERVSQYSGRKMATRDSRGGSRTPGGGSGYHGHHHHGHHHHGKRAGSSYSRSHPSPSSTEETAEETTETDSQAHTDRNDMHRQMYPGYAVPISYQAFQPQMVATAGPMGPIAAAPQQLIMAPNGSVRSVHSVPMLTAAPSIAASTVAAPTWDGEPCPVHHAAPPPHHPAAAAMPLAALYGLAPPAPALSMAGPSSVPPSVISGATTVRRARSVAEISNGGFSLVAPPGVGTPHLDRKSFHGSVHHLPPPPQGHLMRAATLPPRLVLGENGTPSHLPMRESKYHHHANGRSPLPHKSDRGDEGDVGCCSGHFVVIWIILGIITFGILLAIILRFTIA